MSRVRTSGRGWAYTGAISGGVVSIAANIAHSFIPPHGSPPTWAPEPGAVIGAIVWPVFLYIAVEILANVIWPAGLGWQILRWAGLLPVAVLAAFVSYRHLSGLLAHYGEEPIVYYAGPLAVDGLMVMATGALIATGRRRTQPSTPAAPIAVPVVAPSISTTPTVLPTPTPSGVDSPPADPAPPAPSVMPVSVPSPAVLAQRITSSRPAAAPATPAVPAAAGARPTRTRTGKTARPPADRLAPSTTDFPVSASEAAQPTLPGIAPDLLARAAQVAREYRTDHGEPITPGKLAVRLKMTSEQAGHVLAAIDQNTDPTPVNGAAVKATR